MDTNKVSGNLPVGAPSTRSGTPTNQTPDATGSADSVLKAPVSTATGNNEISTHQASTLADNAVVDTSVDAGIVSK